MKTLSFAVTSEGLSHVSRYALENLERALHKSGLQGRRHGLRSRNAQRVVRYLYRCGLARSYFRTSGHAVVVPMMGLLEHQLFPWALSCETVPIVFDCLPADFARWQRLFVRTGVRTAFFTASAAVEHFRQAVPDGLWRWLPEAIDVEPYRSDVPWAARDIDVLEFGRRHGAYHDAIAAGLAAARRMHSYERVRGELVFATQADFIDGLARSKISICFPQSVTHPERFGHVETLTQRYLESMASGCVLLGQAPQELCRLFGYDPVIAVDWSNPVRQIESLITRPECHAAMRARNLDSVRRVGSWPVRARELIDALAWLGYGQAAPPLAEQFDLKR